MFHNLSVKSKAAASTTNFTFAVIVDIFAALSVLLALLRAGVSDDSQEDRGYQRFPYHLRA
jgi:hypothetical protein